MAIAALTAGRRLRASELNAIITKVNLLSAPPLALVRRVANQSIASGGAGTNISWDTEDADQDTMFTATSDTITIKTAGKWQVVLLAALAGSGQFYQITHNAAVKDSVSGVAVARLMPPAFTAAVSDTIKVGVFQSSGSSQNLTATMSVVRISD